MSGSLLPPFAPFLIAALLALVVPGRIRPVLLLLAPAGGAINLWALSQGGGLETELLGYRLELFRVDSLSFLFGILFHIAAFIGGLFALKIEDRLQVASALVYVASALGFVFAGDFITLFIAFEGMTVASTGLVLARRTPMATRVSLRYFGVQASAGLLFLAGALLLIEETGSSHFGQIGLDSLGGILIFVAFGIKCGFPGVHTWLTEAYPASTPTGAVFLSAFTTKAAVYGLARGFPGEEPLIYIGTAMAVFPIFYAVIENDLRRVLCYSMINQLGFMVVGIGLGTTLALNGAVAHAFADVLFKGLLLMTMGAVLHQTGKINGSELGGLYRSMPLTTGLCLIGAASISAFPLFSGFVTKSMIMAAAAEQGYSVIWFLLLFASAGVFHHAGIKIPFFAFFAHDSGLRPRDPSWNMLGAMAIGAGLCLAIGIHPVPLYALLPYPVDYLPYTLPHVIAQLQLLFFSALAFAWLKMTGLYPPELRSINIDADWLLRRALLPGVRRLADLMIGAAAGVERVGERPAKGLLGQIFRVHGPEGVFGRTWLTGNTVLWVAALLGLYLIIYYT